jgi:hypothetical protein
VSFTGVGEDLGCSVVPDSIDFGSIGVGGNANRSFTITHTGTCGTLTGFVDELCDEFEIVSGGGAFSLTPGQSTSVLVRFSPLTTGAKSCTITLGSMHCSDVACIGTAIP